MDFLCKPLNQETLDCSSEEDNIHKCPFLRNINKPTNFSFAALNIPVPNRGGKGPMFEDGPNFDLAFSLFHGRDGIVPLTGNSRSCPDKREREAVLEFNPLASNVASISMSAFGPGGLFSFNSIFGDMKNKKSESSKKKEHLSKSDASKHEALGSEWLETGNCPIAKSYRAVSHVLPLVASAFRPPPRIKFKCPPAVVAARAALARTGFVKSVRPQPLPAKMLVIGFLGIAANIPLGIWREHTKKFSLSWFTAVHAAVPFIAMLRKSVVMPKTAMALTIAGSILGQMIGSRAERFRLKAKPKGATLVAQAPEPGLRASSPPQPDGIAVGHCSNQGIVWDPLSTNRMIKSSPSPARVCF